MNMDSVADFTNHYQSMSDDEIALLHANPNLTNEARAALNSVIRVRKIDFATIRQEQAEEEFQIDEKRKADSARQERRDEAFLRWALIIGIPIIVLGELLHPGKGIEIAEDAAIRGVGFFYLHGCSIK